ncbi:MAG TPA: AMP-binding protein [Streptosporangiaceae bacterium]|nr:AMP-binding protein [Streptosporangiaceae bacterium]
MRLLVKQAVRPLEGELLIPSSRYRAHRALILASLAPGTSRIEGLSDAGHVRYTIQALRRLGTNIDIGGDTFVVRGGPWTPSRPDVSVGSSGTTGQVSIVATLSQWISGLLLLAPFATGPSVITVEGGLNEHTYIDLTIRMMARFGLHVEVSPDWRRFEIEGNQQPHPAAVTLPPDVGAAAFGLAVTALHPSGVWFRGLNALSSAETDHPEAHLIDIARAMGLPMTREDGLVRVRHDGITLAPFEVDCTSVPDMLPVLSVLATLMPIFREREMAFMLARSKARVLFVPAAFRGRDHAAETAAVLAAPGHPPVDHVVVLDARGCEHFKNGKAESPVVGPVRWHDYATALGRVDRTAVDRRAPAPTDRAQLLFTSGTSAEPKGVIQRMDRLSRAAAMEVRHLGLDRSDRIFIPSPLAHQTGFLYGMWLAFILGVPQILQPVWDGEAALAALCRHGGTFVQAAMVWGSDGRALRDIKLRVTDDDGNVLAPGQEGNFEVHSPTLFEGYLDHPEWTAEVMTPDGWYRSGDLAVISETGYVRITGRAKDVINRGGEKVPVAEVEQLLHTHPLVSEVAIVARPDERLGERACAFAVAAPGFDFEAVKSFLDERHVAKQYWPERLELVDAMPRNPVGKIKKFVLRDWARAQTGQR